MGRFSRFEDHCEAQQDVEDYIKFRQDRNENVEETEEYERLLDRRDETRSWWRR